MFKILVVDDDVNMLELLGPMLQKQGFEVYNLAEPEDTIKIANAFKPDLIILDVNLCDHDGRDICKELKADDATKKIKIILYSAEHDHEDNFQEYGADDFIKKPFESDYLFSKLNFHLQ
jgi:DNA-binding response OmpR family regulator